MEEAKIGYFSKMAPHWFNEKGYKVIPWCARSSDLNPIEHVWSWIDGKLPKYKIFSVEHLKQQLSECWAELLKDYCMILIESMPLRIQLCIKAKGRYFKY